MMADFCSAMDLLDGYHVESHGTSMASVMRDPGLGNPSDCAKLPSCERLLRASIPACAAEAHFDEDERTVALSNDIKLSHVLKGVVLIENIIAVLTQIIGSNLLCFTSDGYLVHRNLPIFAHDDCTTHRARCPRTRNGRRH